MVSRADAAAFFMKPGKKQANELLKKCRQAIPYGKEHVGQIVHFEDVVPEFCWQGWLAGQAQAEDIFKSKAGDHIRVINCFAEAFPEREPNAGQLPMDQTHLRVDIVCERSDGSAIRLHPSKDKDARIRVGFLDQWRDGVQAQGGHQIPMDKDAVEVARERALLAPQENTTRPAAVQADPCSNNNATQLAAGAATTMSQQGDVTQLADGTVADGTVADTPGACGSGDQPPMSSSTQQRQETPTPNEPQLQPQHQDGAIPYGWAKYQFEGRYWWHNEGSNTWFWEEQPPPETSQEGSGTLPAGPDTSNDHNSSTPNDNTHDHQHPPRNAAYNAAAPPDLSDDRQLRKKR